jgi:hypothetical protein
MFKAWVPEPIQTWLRKKLQKSQFDALSKVYNEIMNDPVNPPKNPHDALYRAAKTVGLDQRLIHNMFGDKGLPSKV